MINYGPNPPPTFTPTVFPAFQQNLLPDVRIILPQKELKEISHPNLAISMGCKYAK